MSEQNQEKRQRALLVGVQLLEVDDAQHDASLEELRRLVQTLGFEVAGRIWQQREVPDAATFLGRGKVDALADWVKFSMDAEDEACGIQLFVPEEEAPEEGNEGAKRVDAIVFNNALTPVQVRNLEKVLDVQILDRKDVIIEIFSQHAQTKEARLQVELARLQYLAPRLRFRRKGLDRQGGGIGAKGAGETAHELDRRRIRDRIAQIRHQLEDIWQEQERRLERRKEAARVALVGYTNAGKSSWMRALTGGDELVMDKLFATLGTKVRAMAPEGSMRILVSDTVGFLKELPHELVASFHSTLREAEEASLLLHVVDVSEPTYVQQMEVTEKTLQEVGASDVPCLLVLNKADRLTPEEREWVSALYPDALVLSAHDSDDVQCLRARIEAFFLEKYRSYRLKIPFSQGELVGEVYKRGHVLTERHDEFGTWMVVRAPDSFAKRFRSFLVV